jgi:hypothetical protein
VIQHFARASISRTLLAGWLGAAALSCGSEPLDLSDGEIDQADLDVTSQKLQLEWGAHVSFQAVPYAFSAAALRFTNVQAGMPHASCGATFVSNEYAVTAAHCVKHLATRNGKFTMEQIGASSVDPLEFSKYVTVSGDWNNGGFYNLGPLMTGYASSLHTGCYVSRRCGGTGNGGRDGCPIPETVDIALIRCPGRSWVWGYAQTSSALAAYGLPADVDNSMNVNTNVLWFHEVYSLPGRADGSQGWLHYGKYDTSNPGDNWHYQIKHQLLPLFSSKFPNGAQQHSIPRDIQVHPTTNSIDTPGCHGTSGSGVFVDGLNILLGPVVTVGSAASARASGQLCDVFDDAQPGQRNLNYIRAEVTDRFVRNSPEVASTR